MMRPRAQFHIRPAATDDAGELASLYIDNFGAAMPLPRDAADVIEPAGASRLLQTGHAFLVALLGDTVVGAVRHGDRDGIAWLDLLVSAAPGAGAALLRAVENRAQDHGLRLVHAAVPDGSPVELFFNRHGYVGYSREADDQGRTWLHLERRLPLLTVRQQRRSDAEAIAILTGREAWVFEQNVLPGWFVASDGERVVGAVSVGDLGGGAGEVSVPALLDDYRGRGLEVWMVERAATHGETGGYHTLQLAADPTLEPLARDLEDRRWFREGDHYVKRLAPRAARNGPDRPGQLEHDPGLD